MKNFLFLIYQFSVRVSCNWVLHIHHDSSGLGFWLLESRRHVDDLHILASVPLELVVKNLFPTLSVKLRVLQNVSLVLFEKLLNAFFECSSILWTWRHMLALWNTQKSEQVGPCHFEFSLEISSFVDNGTHNIGSYIILVSKRKVEALSNLINSILICDLNEISILARLIHDDCILVSKTWKARIVTQNLPLLTRILLKIEVFGVILVKNQFRMVHVAIENKCINLPCSMAADPLKSLGLIYQHIVHNLLLLFLLNDVLLVAYGINSRGALLDFCWRYNICPFSSHSFQELAVWDQAIFIVFEPLYWQENVIIYFIYK